MACRTAIIILRNKSSHVFCSLRNIPLSHFFYSPISFENIQSWLFFSHPPQSLNITFTDQVSPLSYFLHITLSSLSPSPLNEPSPPFHIPLYQWTLLTSIVLILVRIPLLFSPQPFSSHSHRKPFTFSLSQESLHSLTANLSSHYYRKLLFSISLLTFSLSSFSASPQTISSLSSLFSMQYLIVITGLSQEVYFCNNPLCFLQGYVSLCISFAECDFEIRLNIYFLFFFHIDPAGWPSARALPRHKLLHQLDTTCLPSPHHKELLWEPEKHKVAPLRPVALRCSIQSQEHPKTERKLCSVEPYYSAHNPKQWAVMKNVPLQILLSLPL